jgi:hypothetical protein
MGVGILMADEQDRIRTQRAIAAELKAKQEEEARQKRMDELKAEREARMAEEAKARAASDPMKDPTNRPEAPQLDDGYIRYYSWIGGVTTGSWRLYKEKKDSPNAASAEARSEAGTTQASFSSSVGANTLKTTSTSTDGPGTQPGKAWVLSPDGKKWVQPSKPADGEYTWNDDTGWVKKTTPSAGPGPQPGKAWVLSPDGKSWVKPTMPTDGQYDWNDDTGWTKKTSPSGEPPGKPGRAWILSPDGKSWVKPTMPTDGTYEWNDDTGWSKKASNPTAFVTGTSFIGFGTNRMLRTFYSDGTYVDTPAPESSDTGASTNTTDPALLALIESLKAQNAALAASQAAAQKQAQEDAKAAAAAAEKQRRESALVVLTDRFSKYGLASLVPKIKELITSGASEDTIALQLQDTEEYKLRFKANQDRIKKGLSVLDPSTYLALEDDYRQILRAYGLKQFDNDDYVQQFISNDISTTELSNRVVTAVQRVQNADPAVLATLRGFYGISDNDLVAYVLDPNQQFQKIERQVAAAEIGTAARLQGINAGVAVSEQLAAQGVTKAQAQKGYATIADILPTAEKLSDIYGKTLDEYRLGEAEQEVFNTLASAQRKRQKLVEREIATFTGSSGLGRGSLGTQTGGQI